MAGYQEVAIGCPEDLGQPDRPIFHKWYKGPVSLWGWHSDHAKHWNVCMVPYKWGGDCCAISVIAERFEERLSCANGHQWQLHDLPHTFTEGIYIVHRDVIEMDDQYYQLVVSRLPKKLTNLI